MLVNRGPRRSGVRQLVDSRRQKCRPTLLPSQVRVSDHVERVDSLNSDCSSRLQPPFPAQQQQLLSSFHSSLSSSGTISQSSQSQSSLSSSPPSPSLFCTRRKRSSSRIRDCDTLSPFLLGITIVILLSLVSIVSGQDILSRRQVLASSSSDNIINHNKGHHGNHFGCDCMEYWTCILSGGTPYSYCGIHAHDVCCFVPVNAEPVGILPTPRQSKCGKKGFDSGHDGEADMAEWPWHAAILEKPQDLYVCGSTLLDESWILTAAHCVDDYLPFVRSIPDILKVRLGEYDVSTTAEPLRHEEFNISDIVIHPGFNNSTLVHDIALLKLERPAKKKQNIDVVCMPKHNDFHHDDRRNSVKCYVTGWGRRTETSEHSLVLKEISVPLWSYDSCNLALQAQFGPAYKLPSTTICAGAEGRDACDGDGGGPLVCEKNNQWYQVGIVSFGIGCGRRNIPGVYTSVEAYGEWIEETILAAKSSRVNPTGEGNTQREIVN